MATAIKVPDIGTTVDQVRLVRWLRKEGEPVKRGEALCEVETDKAVSELESVAEGVVLKILVPEDTEVAQNAVIAYVGEAGERLPEAGNQDTATPRPAPERETPRGGPPTPGTPVPPMIRNLARKEGVDLERVTGTGPGKRITREDVLKARAKGAPEGTPLSANQAVVAKRVARSQQQIPPIHLSARLDMSRAIAERERLKTSGRRVSFDALFLKAVATVMRDFPHFRSRLEGDSVIESDAVVPGIAVSVGHELYTPVVRNADALDIAALESRIRDLQEKAKGNALTRDELQGGTLTLSNLGMYPVLSFSAVIPPDQVAVLSVGTTEATPVVKDGELGAVQTAMVTLSVNHRLINGREGAEFLTALKEAMESL